MPEWMILALIALVMLVVFLIAPILVHAVHGEGRSTKGNHVGFWEESEVATYQKPEYRITNDGNLWFGPTNSESMMHWAYLDGVDAEGKSVWVLSRTEEPVKSLPATKAEAEFIMRIAQDVGRH